MKIMSFRGPYSFLSNFHYSNFVYRGVEWPTAEHAYQASKTLDGDSWIKIMQCSTPGQAKQVGKTIPIQENWDELKVLVMYGILQEKFKQSVSLRRQLIHTGDAELIEGNTWHDNFWGDCSCPKCKEIPGENMLGKLLMRVRRELNE